MFSKFYVGIKNFIKEHLVFLLVLILIFGVLRFPTGYVIYRPGGTIDIANRISIDGEDTTLSGSLSMVYVGMIEGTLPFYLLGRIIPSWELVPKEYVTASDHETIADANRRNRLFFEESVSIAKKIAYQHSDIPFEIINEKNYIIFVDERASSDLMVGDQLLKFNGQTYQSLNEFRDYIQSKEAGDIITLTIKRNNHQKNIETAIFVDDEENSRVGLNIVTTFKIEAEQMVVVDSQASETGPSGGLMLTLAIYSALTNNDITRGNIIVGSGTINLAGEIGRVGGIGLKLSGAVRNNADIFIVANDVNYQEARRYATERNYDIIIRGVNTFEETLEFLKNVEVR